MVDLRHKYTSSDEFEAGAERRRRNKIDINIIYPLYIVNDRY